MQKLDHNIGFGEKRHFSAKNGRKSQKIVIITSTPDWAKFYGVRRNFLHLKIALDKA
jgi:hypothetical protein